MPSLFPPSSGSSAGSMGCLMGCLGCLTGCLGPLWTFFQVVETLPTLLWFPIVQVCNQCCCSRRLEGLMDPAQGSSILSRERSSVFVFWYHHHLLTIQNLHSYYKHQYTSYCINRAESISINIQFQVIKCEYVCHHDDLLSTAVWVCMLVYLIVNCFDSGSACMKKLLENKHRLSNTSLLLQEVDCGKWSSSEHLNNKWSFASSIQPETPLPSSTASIFVLTYFPFLIYRVTTSNTTSINTLCK